MLAIIQRITLVLGQKEEIKDFSLYIVFLPLKRKLRSKKHRNLKNIIF
jgi:hypothetical protein